MMQSNHIWRPRAGVSRAISLVLVTTALMAAAQTGLAATPGVFSIRDYGAAGDGKTPDTAAINKAIEACAAAGGGQVLLPPGK
jgi:polygalacturonase